MDQEFIKLFGANVSRNQIVSVQLKKSRWDVLYRAVLVLIGIIWAILVAGLIYRIELVTDAFDFFSSMEHRWQQLFPQDEALDITLLVVVPLIATVWVFLWSFDALTPYLRFARPVVVLSNTKLLGPVMRLSLADTVTNTISRIVESRNPHFNGFIALPDLSVRYRTGDLIGGRGDIGSRKYSPSFYPVLSELSPVQPLYAIMYDLNVAFQVGFLLANTFFLVWFGLAIYFWLLFALDLASVFYGKAEIINAFSIFFKYIILYSAFNIGSVLVFRMVTGWLLRNGWTRLHVLEFDGTGLRSKMLLGDAGYGQAYWTQSEFHEALESELGITAWRSTLFKLDHWLLPGKSVKSTIEKLKTIESEDSTIN